MRRFFWRLGYVYHSIRLWKTLNRNLIGCFWYWSSLPDMADVTAEDAAIEDWRNA